MNELTLYSTAGCHLCDEAAVLLEHLCVSYTVQDIIDDAQLVEKYGIKIPVLTNASGNELDWPFDLAMLKNFLEIKIC